MQERFAIEVIREAKVQSKRKDIIIILLIVLFFLSNVAWLVAWNLPAHEVTTESYDMQGEDSANVFYNGEGEVKINVEDKSDENKDNHTDEPTEK